MTIVPAPSGWERSIDAAEKVKERMLRAAWALDAAGVRYAVAGGNAVAEWVARADDGATRYTKDVDILVERGDLPAVRATLEGIGFVSLHLFSAATFIDGPLGKPSSGIQLLFAGEPFRPGDAYPLPTLDQSERGAAFQVVTLEALMTMKLVAWRRLDRVHIRDLIGVGLVDSTWPARFPPLLGERLQQLLDDPDG